MGTEQQHAGLALFSMLSTASRIFGADVFPYSVCRPELKSAERTSGKTSVQIKDLEKSHLLHVSNSAGFNEI